MTRVWLTALPNLHSLEALGSLLGAILVIWLVGFLVAALTGYHIFHDDDPPSCS